MMVHIMKHKLGGAKNTDYARVRFYKIAKNKSIAFILKVRKIPIIQRIFLGFLLISVLPIALVGTYSNSNYEKSITSKLNSYSGQLVQEITKNVKNETDQYEKLSESIIMNDDVQDGIIKFNDMNDVSKNKLMELLTNKFSRELFNYKNVKNISIRFPDGNIFYDLGYEIFNENDIIDIIKHTDNAIGNTYWTRLGSNLGNSCIVLSRVVYSKHSYLEKRGYLLIVIDERIFAQNTYKNIDLGKGSDLFIMRSDGAVVSTVSGSIKKDTFIKDNNLKTQIYNNYLKNNNTFRYRFPEGDFLVAGSFLPSLDWYIVGKIPYRFISSQSSEVKNNVIFASIIVISASIILSLIIYASVSIPLKSLLHSAKNIRDGNLEEEIDDRYNDEISELTFNIKAMVERLKALIVEIERQHFRKREAELKMLQAQINPHFLFNTLNSLKWSAMLSGNKTLEDGLGALSGLLKDTILNKEEIIPLEKEIENLNNYATIQGIRYANSFSLSYEIEKGLEKCMVIKFLLQPIVENSIIHGIDEDERTVSIKISAGNIEDVLLIRIADDGKGFDTESMDGESRKNKLSGIGIENVNERIKLNFGDGYGLTTKSKKGKGTATEIILPLILWEGDDNVQYLNRG